MKKITTPLTYEKIKDLRAGEFIYLSGEIYTARDAAHARLVDTIKSNKELPFDLKDATIYYVGPTPTKPGQVIGSCGPTTSARMDSFTPTLLDLGLAAMIGKGKRSPEVIKSIVDNQAIYLCGIGGAAAITAETIKKVEPICYEDLGTEAIVKLYIEDMPLIVGVDTLGNDLFMRGTYGHK